MIKLVFCVIYIIFAVVGLTLIKLGAKAEDIVFVLPLLEFKVSKLTLAGIVCYGVSFCAYFGVLNYFNLGYIIPVLGGLVNIVIVLVAIFVLKERMSLNMLIGAVLVVIGIVIMNLKGLS